ncbi:hypothetical protein ACC717_35955, partial [Rhizobium ruizarguesonis]
YFGHHAMALGVKSSFVHLIGHNDSLCPEFCTWYGYMNAGAAVGAIESEGARPAVKPLPRFLMARSAWPTRGALHAQLSHIDPFF